MSCFCATEALIASVQDPSALESSSSIRAIALFDNEEVGSVSHHGAQSNMLGSAIKRLADIHIPSARGRDTDGTASEQGLANSFLISSDMAHGEYSRES